MVSKEFMLAGNATMTVSNGHTHYTYKIQKVNNTYFIRVLTGADNENNYTYLGVVNQDGVKLTAKSKYTSDTLLYKVANWMVRLVLSGNPIPSGYTIDHSGACGRCGRKLTTPTSISLGLGPICAGL